MLLSDALLGYQELASLPIKHHFDVSEINSYKYAIDFLKQLSENFYIDLDDSLPYPKITKIYSEAILELSESYLP